MRLPTHYKELVYAEIHRAYVFTNIKKKCYINELLVLSAQEGDVWTAGFDAISRPGLDDTANGIFIPGIKASVPKTGRLISWNVYFDSAGDQIAFQVNEIKTVFFLRIYCILTEICCEYISYLPFLGYHIKYSFVLNHLKL